jgi:hypothetical protein
MDGETCCSLTLPTLLAEIAVTPGAFGDFAEEEAEGPTAEQKTTTDCHCSIRLTDTTPVLHRRDRPELE